MDPQDRGRIRTLRSKYYMGRYKECIEAAVDLKMSSSSYEFEVLALRAQLELDAKQVAAKVNQNSPIALQAVNLLATYRLADADNKELAVDAMQEWLDSELTNTDSTLQLIATQMFVEQNDYASALKYVVGDKDDIEKLAMATFIFLKMNRNDLAAKTLHMMENVDDDDCITQLASAWVGLQSGEQDKIVQASFTFEELADKYEKSFVLYNGLAACELAKGQWKKAFSHLKNARNSALQQGQAVPAETLVNTIIVLHHMGKSAAVAKVKAELVELYPNHPWLAQQDKIAATFDSAAHTQSS